MMELKLMEAAVLLPKPNLEFWEIDDEAKNRAKVFPKPQRMLRIAAALILVLCMVSSVYAYGKIHYGLWSGINSRAFADVKLLSWEYDYHFPESLGGSPFQSVSTWYGAPRGATHWEAILIPTYKLCSIQYGVELSQNIGDGIPINTEQQISVGFGTTTKEQWKYHFSVAEDGSSNYEKVDEGSQRTVTYKECVLHVYSAEKSYCVRWEDQEREMVISIICDGVENQEAAVEIAKELIDLNQ